MLLQGPLNLIKDKMQTRRANARTKMLWEMVSSIHLSVYLSIPLLSTHNKPGFALGAGDPEERKPWSLLSNCFPVRKTTLIRIEVPGGRA